MVIRISFQIFAFVARKWTSVAFVFAFDATLVLIVMMSKVIEPESN